MVYDLLNSWGHEGYELHCDKYVTFHLSDFFSDMYLENDTKQSCSSSIVLK